MIKGAGAQLIGRARSGAGVRGGAGYLSYPVIRFVFLNWPKTDLMLPVPDESRPVFRSEDPLHACYELHDALGGNLHNKYVHLKRCTSGPIRITTTMRLVLEFACSLRVHATVSGCFLPLRVLLHEQNLWFRPIGCRSRNLSWHLEKGFVCVGGVERPLSDVQC